MFRKLKSSLADALFGVGATMALEIGEGFAVGEKSGVDFHNSDQDYGGIRGGISTGHPISLRVAFKPTSSRDRMIAIRRTARSVYRPARGSGFGSHDLVGARGSTS